MILITESIPRQGFEIVSEQVGAILAVELANQRTLQNLLNNHEVYHERTSPYDKSEDVMINVMFDNVNFEGRTQASAHGPEIINVDVFANSPSRQGERGDGLAALLIKKYAGMCRYILDSTKYNTLLLPQGTVSGVNVESVQMYDIENPQDAKNVRMARLAYRVRINECQQLWGATTLTGNDTGVKLAATDLGYKYELS
jgi:hypothetical protein